MKVYYTLLDNVVIQEFDFGNEFNGHSLSEGQKKLLKAIQSLPFEKDIIGDWHDTETYDDGGAMEVRYKCYREVESGKIRLYDQTRDRKGQPNEDGSPAYYEEEPDANDPETWTEFANTKSPFEIVFVFSNYFQDVYRKRDDLKQMERHAPRLHFLIDLEKEMQTLDTSSLPKNHYKRVIKEKLVQ